MLSVAGNAWVSPPRRPGLPVLRLFCFPFAGGGAAIFRHWPDELPPQVDVRAIQLPGREHRLVERPLTNAVQAAASIADALLPLTDVPYSLFGHSMGALLAYETALAMLRRHGPAPKCLMVSGRRAPQVAPRKGPLHLLPDAMFVEELRRLKGTPQEVLDNAELMDIVLPILRSDFELSETPKPASPQPLPCRVVAFGGKEDSDVSRDDLTPWAAASNGEFALHMLEDDHFFINSQRRALLALIADEVLERTA